MPTLRPRYQVTETPEVARAIDLAAHLWPDEPRSRLLLRLIQAGLERFEQSQDAQTTQRRAAVAASSGKYALAFGPNFLGDLRRDWPE